ncbi:MAG: hypothetical protein JW798_11720 [Prolixibacteraceae bacterium]|nr:hypothetical protein [Prolixibacteraceae bacterium]
MLEFLPPIILECPDCGEVYVVSNPLNNKPSEKRIAFSDGFFIDELNPRVPGIIGCVTCELGFFPENGKLIASPEWEEFHEKWAHLKRAAPPSAGNLALELRIRRKMDEKTEKIILKEFWYAGNHSDAGRKLLQKNEKFKKFWAKSLERFEELLNAENNYERILKAELNRQFGRFDECLMLLSSFTDEFSEIIRKKATAGETEVFRVI